jgi:flagellar protein FlbB
VARYGKVGAGPKIAVLVLLVLVLTALGLWWFDYLGLIDVRDVLSPVYRLVGLPTRTVIPDTDDPFLLDRQRISSERAALELRREELDRYAETLTAREIEIERRAGELEQKEKSLNDRENSLNERVRAYDNRNANLEQIAVYLTGMPPQNAVNIIEEMPDQDVIDVFRVVERIAAQNNQQSIVAFWISLLEPERAATLKLKMLERPGA